jgi:hypothetical protein
MGWTVAATGMIELVAGLGFHYGATENTEPLKAPAKPATQGWSPK